MTPTAFELSTLAEVNRRALELAGSGAKAGICAAIVREDRVLAFGENEVFAKSDPTRHAEIVAIGRACAAIGKPDLSGTTLISSLQPCEMCLAAMRFSRIGRLLFAADQARVAGKYFMFPRLTIEAFHAATDESFCWCGGVDADEVLALYAQGRE